MTKRTIDTMDEKDWIILRLMRACGQANPRSQPDFIEGALWLDAQLDLYNYTPGGDLMQALKADDERRRPIDLYHCGQWANQPFEAYITSVMVNDNE